MKIDPNKLCFWLVVFLVWAFTQIGCDGASKNRARAIATCRMVVQADTGCKNVHVSQLVRTTPFDSTIQFEACGKLVAYQYGFDREGGPITCWKISK